MPGSGASLAKRLGACARGLDALEAGAASARPIRREYTDEEIVEIGLIMLAYVYEGDTGRYAEHLVKDDGLPYQEANEMAGTRGRILEERRKTAAKPGYPV